MPQPVGDPPFDIKAWKDLLNEVVFRPAARHRVEPESLAHTALSVLWEERAHWTWPPDSRKLREFLYRLAREMAQGPPRSRRRPRPRRRPVPALCGRLVALLRRVRKPRQYEDAIVRLATEIAPSILENGRFREFYLAWHKHVDIETIGARVGEADPAVIRKRLARASKTLDRALLERLRPVLGGPARRLLDAWRRGSLPRAEEDALAEEVARVIDALGGEDETERGETAREAE